jgi:hypothetical protein
MPYFFHQGAERFKYTDSKIEPTHGQLMLSPKAVKNIDSDVNMVQSKLWIGTPCNAKPSVGETTRSRLKSYDLLLVVNVRSDSPHGDRVGHRE